jgi:hypothetical protein
MAPNEHKPDKDKTASISIDGDDYEVPRENNLVADLIRLTGADPAVTDLIRVKGREQETLADHARISVNPSSKFVTVSTEPTPVA